VLTGRTARLAADHPQTLSVRDDLATLYRDRGKYELAEAQYKEVLAARTVKQGADHPTTLYCRYRLGLLYRFMNRPDEAIVVMEETVKRAKATGHPMALGMQAALGTAYCDARRFADAVPVLEEVHRRAPIEDPVLAGAGTELLTAYVGAGKTAEARALASEQAQAARRQFPAGSLELAAALAAPGRALVEAGAYADAEPLLLDNYKGLRQAADEARRPSKDQQILLQDAVMWLVRLYDTWGKPEEAAKWRKELEAAQPAGGPARLKGP
jgi:tetratricopeptide (TPR) repeat protein